MDQPLLCDSNVRLLVAFIEHVKEWHTKQSIRDEFHAPILPIVQSSGTGKTRPLKAYRTTHTLTRLILLQDTGHGIKKDNKSSNSTFDAIHNIGHYCGVGDESYKREKFSLRKMVLDQCNAAVAEHAEDNKGVSSVNYNLKRERVQPIRLCF